MATVYVSNLVIYTGTKFEQTFALEDSDTNSVKRFFPSMKLMGCKKFSSTMKELINDLEIICN